jgi:uncharacterized protein
MSRPVVIDSQEFGRGEGSLQGDVLVATLTRLHDLLTDTGGSLSFRIDGRRGARGRSQLLLTVDGMLSLCCQRCLEAYEYPLHLRSLLEFVGNDEDLTQDELEDDAKDYLPHQQALDVVVLIEDEILLALPQRRGTRIARCRAAGWSRRGCHRFRFWPGCKARSIESQFRSLSWLFNRTRSPRRSAACIVRTIHCPACRWRPSRRPARCTCVITSARAVSIAARK